MNMISGEMAGMDTLSKDFDAAAAEVQELKSRLERITTNTVGSAWKGKAANNFQNLWDAQFKGYLTSLNEALVAAGNEVENRKQALISADA